MIFTNFFFIVNCFPAEPPVTKAILQRDKQTYGQTAGQIADFRQMYQYSKTDGQTDRHMIDILQEMLYKLRKKKPQKMMDAVCVCNLPLKLKVK